MNLTEFITENEGRRKKPYKCPAGFNTIGVGWNMDSNRLPRSVQEYLNDHGEITEEMIDMLLDLSISRALNDCASLFPDFNNFSANRKIALTDFLFNVGYRRAIQFIKAIHAINVKDWDKAADEMIDSKWFVQVPNRALKVVDMVRNG